MSTIRDVAKKAGVAPITVSRVINNASYVSEKTRARVEAAIQELGYVPNMLGQSLRFNQTKTLALVLTDITNPFWTTIARGVEDAAHENGYSVILCNTDESSEKQDQYLTMLLKRRIDGIIFVPTHSSINPVERIQKQKITVVVLDRDVPSDNVDMIRGDSFGGAYQLTRHLIELGHKHIAAMAGPKDVSTSIERVAGFCHALQEAGLNQSMKNVFWGSFNDQQMGAELAEAALQLVPKPTAFLTINNFIANGVLHQFAHVGLRIPEDVSIVSFDDFPVIIYPAPFLTVAVQPAYEMGYKATQLLLARLKDEGLDSFQKLILPTEIFIRQSSAPPPKE
ncbi:MAG: LacI family transcriptional regulator [Chloroflexi bacterium]|nr:MAG: LacI family transcriptional regulator [Chloroflexota bacterium]